MRRKNNGNTSVMEAPTATRSIQPAAEPTQTPEVSVDVEQPDLLVPFKAQIKLAHEHYRGLSAVAVSEGKRGLFERDGLTDAARLAQATLSAYCRIVYQAEKKDFSDTELARIKGEQFDLATAVRKVDQLEAQIGGKALTDSRVTNRKILSRDEYGTPETELVTIKGQNRLSIDEKIRYAADAHVNFQKAEAAYRKAKKAGKR